MRDTFLSIDLDYFDCIADFDNPYLESKMWLRFKKIRDTLFKEIFFERIPINVVVHHDEMVPFINNSKCVHIINMDYHSDLTTEPGIPLGEGSVFDFIEHKKSKTYTWLMPRSSVGKLGGYGRCDDRFDEEGNPIDAFKKKNWVYMHQKKTINRNTVNLDKVQEVCVCISPPWITHNSKDFIKGILIPIAPHIEKRIKGCLK